MKFGILQQPIGTLQIPSRDLQRVFKFAKLMRKIQNELRSQKRNASRSLPVIVALHCNFPTKVVVSLNGPFPL